MVANVSNLGWLIDHGHNAEGLKTLAKLHAHGDENDPWVRAEYDQIQEAISFEHEHEAKSYIELFRNKSCFRRLYMVCALQAAAQMTGVSVSIWSWDVRERSLILTPFFRQSNTTVSPFSSRLAFQETRLSSTRASLPSSPSSPNSCASASLIVLDDDGPRSSEMSVTASASSLQQFS